MRTATRLTAPRSAHTHGKLVFLVAMMVMCCTPLNAQSDFVTIPAKSIEYQAVPNVPGLAVALLIGDPDKAGAYVVRVRFSPGTMTPPHTHDQDRTVTVIEGTWSFGTDESGVCENTVPLESGSVAVHPAGKVHFDGSCGEEVIVQISGMGPAKTEWLSQPAE